jgi:hypothetical protein
VSPVPTIRALVNLDALIPLPPSSAGGSAFQRQVIGAVHVHGIFAGRQDRCKPSCVSFVNPLFDHLVGDPGTSMPSALAVLRLMTRSYLVGRITGRSRRQGHGSADARIKPLSYALDYATLARRIAAFEQHDHLELLVHHPILQLHEFALQPQQLLEIHAAIDGFLPRAVAVVEQARQAVVVDLQLELFLDTVYQLVMLALIAEQPDLSLDEVVVAMRKRRIRGSRTAVWRFFARRGFTLKKSLRAAEQQRPDVACARRRWRREQFMFDPARPGWYSSTKPPPAPTW